MVHRRPRPSLRLVVIGSAITVVAALGSPALAGVHSDHPGPAGLLPALQHSSITPNDDAGGEPEDIMDSSEEFAAVRTAPGTSVSAAAFTAAGQAASKLPQAGSNWQQVTNQPYNSDAVAYRDPTWSNSSGGNGLVSGRMTALAADGNAIYAGAADGGVWKSTDHGRNWKPVFDPQNDLSIGALAVDPVDHSIWVGTGEPNTNADSFAGDGIFRSGDGGKTWQLVGNALPNYLVYRITFDGAGHVYAATSRGLLRRSALDLASRWRTVLKPDPNPDNSPYRTSFITDVQVQPGSNGKVVIAALGWRGGTQPGDVAYNGFYESTNGGTKFTEVTPTGDLSGATDIGRTTFAYTPDGKVLYALIESSSTVELKGVYKSVGGSLTGPWTQIADAATLTSAGSALALSGGTPGQQAWYNQALAVDPANDNHLIVDLEEVFETTDGGSTWSTIGPYWNFPFPCWSAVPAQDTCPDTTHPDQHALLISGGTLYAANDGGVYSHPLADTGQVAWRDLNANLHTLQYYAVGMGRDPSGGYDIWGGMQDNGTGLLRTKSPAMVQPFGGDGGDVIVNPENGNQAVNEYTDLSAALTTDGGRAPEGEKSAYSTISPSCLNPIYTSNPCDPNPRFIAPISADVTNVNHWVAGGEFVWDNQGKGWNTHCSATACDWIPVHDTGTGNTINAIADAGSVTYAGWCGNGCNPAGTSPFTSGIDTNYGGTWHTVSSTVLPNRIPTSFTLDPTDFGHVIVTYGAFSRNWIPGAGVGHVFVSSNGGGTWTDISGNLPDAPVNASVTWHGKLVVGTDVGVFATSATTPGQWVRLGRDLPGTPAIAFTAPPNQSFLIVATHGRGLWKLS
jgi:hypothetical protein